PRRLFALSVLLVSGCLWPVRDKIDHDIAFEVARPFDVAPEQMSETASVASARKSDSAKLAMPSLLAAAQIVPVTDLQTTAYLQSEEQPNGRPSPLNTFDVTIPDQVPGSEVPRIQLPADKAAKAAEIRRIYPALPPLPEESAPLPGPNGKPYT